MKTLLSLLVTSFITINSFAQSIPNPSFESWYPYATGEYPTGWTSSDSVAFALGGGTSVFSGTDAYDGSLSIHLKSVSTSFGIKGPGLATNGVVTFSGSAFVFSGGSPDTLRARFMTGYYKYTPNDPNGLDQGFIRIILLADSANNTDTVAQGITYFSDTVSTYTPFFTMLNYNEFHRNPDTCLIIISSSMDINHPNLGVGSELVIDSLGFSGLVGITEINSPIQSVQVFPSPADKEITVAVELKSKTDLIYTVFDLNGKKVLTAPMNSSVEKIDISNLRGGNYIVSLSDKTNKVLYTENISIAR